MHIYVYTQLPPPISESETRGVSHAISQWLRFDAAGGQRRISKGKHEKTEDNGHTENASRLLIR